MPGQVFPLKPFQSHSGKRKWKTWRTVGYEELS